ncbi:MAG: SagB/ThcOx family dehydrogenase [Candidatus Riflebacteria bacterium]|nr:SagB/ThcOx family dehydrogenase [Candidatus Riflebacteria bacterium]
MPQQVGERFQHETRYVRHHMPTGFLNLEQMPSPVKEYPGARVIALPDPAGRRTPTLGKVLRARRSVRRYASTPLALADLSFLLWAGNGRQRTEHGQSFRTAPSAGALYPIETYVLAHQVEDVPAGLYHFGVRDHRLEEVALGDFRREITQAALEQGMCREAPAVLLWTAVFARATWKYGQRAYRYVYLDAGHIAQNLALAAAALQLGSCQIAALFDDEVNALLRLDGVEEGIIYMSVVGHPG